MRDNPQPRQPHRYAPDNHGHVGSVITTVPAEKNGEVREKQVNPNKVFIGGLPDDTQRDDLYDCFSQLGDVTSIQLKKGFGFVEFSTREAADTAVVTYNEGKFLGSVIKVEHSHGGGKTARFESAPDACFKCGEAGHWAKHCPRVENGDSDRDRDRDRDCRRRSDPNADRSGPGPNRDRGPHPHRRSGPYDRPPPSSAPRDREPYSRPPPDPYGYPPRERYLPVREPYPPAREPYAPSREPGYPPREPYPPRRGYSRDAYLDAVPTPHAPPSSDPYAPRPTSYDWSARPAPPPAGYGQPWHDPYGAALPLPVPLASSSAAYVAPSAPAGSYDYYGRPPTAVPASPAVAPYDRGAAAYRTRSPPPPVPPHAQGHPQLYGFVSPLRTFPPSPPASPSPPPVASASLVLTSHFAHLPLSNSGRSASPAPYYSPAPPGGGYPERYSTPQQQQPSPYGRDAPRRY